MSESEIFRIVDPVAKRIIYKQQLQIDLLTLEIEKLKQGKVSAIGFHQPSTSSMEMAFPKRQFRGDD